MLWLRTKGNLCGVTHSPETLKAPAANSTREKTSRNFPHARKKTKSWGASFFQRRGWNHWPQNSTRRQVSHIFHRNSTTVSPQAELNRRSFPSVVLSSGQDINTALCMMDLSSRQKAVACYFKKKKTKANKQQFICTRGLLSEPPDKRKKEKRRGRFGCPFGAKMQSSALHCVPKGRPFSGENAISENDLASVCLLMFKVPLQSEVYVFSPSGFSSWASFTL